MIFQRLLMAFVAIAAIATSAAVTVVAASYALFALMQPSLGNAGASAVVMAVFALIVLLGGLLAIPRRKHRVRHEGAAGVAEDLMELVRDNPMAAAGVAVAAGIMAMRNPRVITEVARAFFQSRRKKR